jgi:hypothetical protein
MSDCPEDLVYVWEGFPGFLRKKAGKRYVYLEKRQKVWSEKGFENLSHFSRFQKLFGLAPNRLIGRMIEKDR